MRCHLSLVHCSPGSGAQRVTEPCTRMSKPGGKPTPHSDFSRRGGSWRVRGVDDSEASPPKAQGTHGEGKRIRSLQLSALGPPPGAAPWGVRTNALGSGDRIRTSRGLCAVSLVTPAFTPCDVAPPGWTGLYLLNRTQRTQQGASSRSSSVRRPSSVCFVL